MSEIKKVFDEFDDVFNENLKNLLVEIYKDYYNLDETIKFIYHYTTTNALISILRNNTFRATNVQFMNDPEEITYSIKLFEEIIEEKKHHDNKEIDDMINSFYHDHFLEMVKNNLDRTYISSFSISEDSLHLWDYYGKNDGYSIGFNLSGLINNILSKKIKLKSSNKKYEYEKFSVYFGKVLYDREKQSEYIRKMINLISRVLINEIGKNEEEFKRIEARRIEISQLLISSLYNMKFFPHNIEEEYRIAIVPDKDYDGVEFLGYNGIIKPYIEYRGDLSIEELVIGPKIKDFVSKKGVDIYNRYLNNKIKKIKKSQINIRE